jgi:hypothetical protein
MNTQEDPLVICSMGPGLWTSAGHFILLWDVEDGIAHINDPASTKQSRTENSYNYMASQCRQYFCFNKKPLSQEIVVSTLTMVNNELGTTPAYYILESLKEK